MAEHYPTGEDPLEQLFNVDIASAHDIQTATELAGDLLRHAPYSLARSHIYFTEDDQYLIIATVEEVNGDIAKRTTGAYVYSEDGSENPRMGVEYDESGSLFEQTMDGECPLEESAALVEKAIRQILEHNRIILDDNELAIIDNLLLNAQGIQGKVSYEEYVQRSMQIHMFTAISTVIADKRPVAIKTSTKSGELPCGTKVNLIGNEYISHDSLRDFDSEEYLKRQIDVQPPGMQTTDCLLEYYGGEVKFYPYNMAYDDEDGDESEISQAIAHEAGLFRPTQSAIARITSALLELSLDQTVI